MELWRYNAALWLVKTPMSSPSIGWCISFSEWFNVFQPSTDPGGCLVWTHSFIKWYENVKMIKNWHYNSIDKFCKESGPKKCSILVYFLHSATSDNIWYLMRWQAPKWQLSTYTGTFFQLIFPSSSLNEIVLCVFILIWQVGKSPQYWPSLSVSLHTI